MLSILVMNLVMSAATHGSVVELTFTNDTKTAIKMPIRVRAGIDMYDWLSIKASRTSSAPRNFTFIEARKKSITLEADIAPGKSITEKLDLAWWALRADNGGPLEAGTYDLDLSWRLSPKQTLTTTAKLAIVAPANKVCTEKAVKGLALLVYVAPTTASLQVGVHNADTVTHCIAAYVHAGEKQSDWMTVSLVAGTAKPLMLEFNDDRTKAGIIYNELAPGATSWTTWDLAAWAKRTRNGAVTIPKGPTQIDVVYDAKSEKTAWSGKLSTTIYATLP